MEIFKLNELHKGWFAGDFSPTAFRTKDFEACYRVHPKGEVWETHYHRVATEINVLAFGRMTLQSQQLVEGDVFILRPFEIADPIFETDCGIVCIKVPSVPNDKYVIEK